MERQTQKRKEMEEVYKRTKQYEILITDPSSIIKLYRQKSTKQRISRRDEIFSRSTHDTAQLQKKKGPWRVLETETRGQIMISSFFTSSTPKIHPGRFSPSFYLILPIL